MTTLYEKALSLSSLFDEMLGAGVTEIPNEYTKSVFLTMSHEAYIDMIADNFEFTDKIRFAIEPVIVYKNVESTQWNYSESKIIIQELAINVRNILLEKLYLEDGTEVEVIPVKYNDQNVWLNSPFRKPNSKICYRTVQAGNIILFTEEDVTQYKRYNITYISKLEPIILAELPDELNIQGKNNLSVPEYSRKVLEDITKNAVTLYLQSRVSTQQVQQNPQQQTSGNK
jgi:hypothetical protein